MAQRTRPLLKSALMFATLAALCVGPSALVACGSDARSPQAVDRVEGQSEFVSAPPNGMSDGRGFGVDESSDAPSAGADAGAGPSTGGSGTTVERKVEETDLYRLEGDRLYYLNGYRGLLVFDVADVNNPKLLGRSPIFGRPVEMIVRGGIANVVVSDWYGKMDDGTPFHGSIVRGLDARDPSNIKVLGEARLGGWIRDTRVVGSVLYAVSEEYAYDVYGYGDGDGADTVAVGPGSNKIVVSSVDFGGHTVKQAGRLEFPGWGGIFHVSSGAIMFAHDVTDTSAGYEAPSGKTELQYIDISDPNGAIVPRGKLVVNGSVQGWGTDNGRWNIDFGDGRWAHTIGCSGRWCGESGYVLATADFENPDAPKLASELTIPGTGWTPAARFAGDRMYLSPAGDYWYGSKPATPIQIYDLSNPTSPKLAGSTEIDGNVWLFVPSGDRLFALGNEYDPSGGPYGWGSSKVSLRYLDVSDPTNPSVIGTSSFGEGWAWTPAAGTFKAFAKDDTKGLVVLPFSGWSASASTYTNGLQLIEFTPTSISTKGAARTKGWVERGIFVKDRLVSLSDTALSVIDYSDRANPKVVREVTLARNVVHALPQGETIAQLSSDWYGYDHTKSELRILPISDAEESTSIDAALATVEIEGYDAQVFRNGDLAYVVTNVREAVACSGEGGSAGAPYPGDGYGGEAKCWKSTQKVTVVDLKDGKATVRGTVKLPAIDGGYGGYWGWYGCMAWDWYHGSDVVQVQGDALAFRRWQPVYGYTAEGGYVYQESKHSLFVVDLKNPDAPTIASTTVTTDPRGWWGNMRVAGSTLYVSHYEWLSYPDPTKGESKWYVKYYLDPIDLSDRAAPKIGARINVPGIMVGASDVDPSLVYTIDYRWYGDSTKNELAVVKIAGDKAYLQGRTLIDGWVGNVHVRGQKAYATAERYADAKGYTGPRRTLHEIDLSNPKAPVDRVSAEKKGWGWLLGVQGDRAIVTSGWSGAGIDVYKLQDGAAPVFEQFVRTRGWWGHSLSRQGDTLFLASGYWGIQSIPLK